MQEYTNVQFVFLYYGAINASTCCSQPICTDCYLKVRPPRSDVVDCPFCGKEKFCATVAAAQKSSRIREQISKPMKQTANKDDETTFDDCGSTPASPKTPIQPTIVTSVHERENLEAAMRKQLEVAKKRGDTAPPVPVSAPGGTRIYAPIGGRRRYRTRLAGDGSLPLRDLRALLHSLPTDLHQVEELMILEAMQASIQDEERRQRQLAEEAQHAAEQAGASSTTVENMHGDAENNQDRQTSTDEDPRIRTDSDPRDDYQPAEEEEEMNIFPPLPPLSSEPSNDDEQR